MFEREDWTLFRTVDGLGQKAGVATHLLPAVVAKELVDNALDAAGACDLRFAPAEGTIRVEDRGGGIDGDDDEIARLFSIRRPLTSSKLLRRPTRGALGNGLRVAVGAVLASRGHLTVETRGRVLELAPQFESGNTAAGRVGDSRAAGTIITVRLGYPIAFEDGSLAWAREAIALAREAGPSYSGKPSPHWYDPDSFLELLQAAGRRTVRDVVAAFDRCAEPKAGKIAAPYKGRLARDLQRHEAERLHEILKAMAGTVRPARLGYVGQVGVLPGGYARLQSTFAMRSSRRAGTMIPFVLEAWAETTDGDEDLARLFVNRSPAVAPLEAWRDGNELCLAGCGINHGVATVLRKVRLCLNIETPCMPITSDGKAPDLTPFVGEIVGTVGKAIRGAKRLGRGRVAVAGDIKRHQKDAILGCLEEAIAKAGGANHRYGQRQLYYASRELVKSRYGVAEPTWGYFCRVITDHEARLGRDLPGITRDNRGVLYHPHQADEIPLGTLTVEKYARPAWTFNKVLYCEKEGFFPLLKDTCWPERNDCALLTSKGFASRAARDVIDLLGDTDEELVFFCIHDADAYGTMIHQALEGATTARPGRRVRIINLGLEPDEAMAMGLPVEPVEKKKAKKRAPVADYVPAPWREWLQAKRVELNAMATPRFLEWLDRKFAPYSGKIIPPAPVLAGRLRADVQRHLERAITERVLREAAVGELVRQGVRDREELIRLRAGTLPDDVEDALAGDPARLWDAPVDDHARAIAGEVV